MPDGLLLIHAFPLDRTMWKPQVDAFASRMRVLTPNLPGFGGAEPAGQVMRMEHCADLIAAQLREASEDRVTVCGLSMGGYVALELWKRHPELIDGLVFANTKAAGDDEAARERRKQLAERLRKEGSAFLLESPPPLLSDHAPGELQTFVKGIIAGQPPESIAAASLGMAGRADNTSVLSSISVPTLVITSENDTLIPPDVTSQMAQALPSARLEVLPGAGHLSNLEAADAFNEVLNHYLVHVRVAEHERLPRPPQGLRGTQL